MTKFFNWKETKGWYIGIVIAVLIGLVISPFLPVNPAIAASGVVSIDLNTIEQTIQPLEQQQSSYYSEPTVVQQETWGYKYTLSSGDLVEVGDSRVPEFKAHIKTIRDNSWFSLGWSGGIFTPSLNGLNVSFNFNASTQVNIYPAPPSERLPDGGIEYDIKLLSRPTGNPDITLDIDWSGITWQKLLALDVEYPTEVACVAAFGSEGSPYVRTPTTITGADGVTYKKRAEYEVNSYLGTATSNRDIPQDMGINKTNGQPIVWHNLSTTKLFIHRGEMTDALGQKAWVEDINLDETAKTITFTLPRTWLRNAAYPVSQVCGVDPAYTQTWASFQSTALSGDGIWTDVDTAYNSAVLSMVLSNATTGTENTLGVRANGSLLSRHITLHEAEGGGQTHCRMFVQTDANGIFEAYHSDVSDADYFYYSGYWTNVTFTNTLVSYDPDQLDTWRDTTLIAASAGLVAHFIIDNAESDVKNIMGVRANGSSLERKISVHEPESGGSSYLDLFTKVDSSCIVELYSSDTTNTNIYLDGYFDSGLDFVELWQNIAVSSTGWQSYDITAYLDQDGRMADFLLTHGNSVTTGMTMGARDGDDSSTARTLVEHEAEGVGGDNTEYTGFSMSAKTNSTGIVNLNISDASFDYFYLTGYFKPSATYNISLDVSSKAFGIVAASTTYYAKGSAPSNPVVNGDCTYTVTNNGATAIDIDVKGAAFTGGVGWTLTSGAPGSNTVRITAYYSGQNPASGIVLTTSGQEFISNLAASGTKKWDFKFETGTFTDGVGKSGIITLTARAVS